MSMAWPKRVAGWREELRREGTPLPAAVTEVTRDDQQRRVTSLLWSHEGRWVQFWWREGEPLRVAYHDGRAGYYRTLQDEYAHEEGLLLLRWLYTGRGCP